MPNSPNTSDRFVTVHGPNGEFKIASRGRGREDSGSTYVYRDSAHQFTFMSDVNWKEKIAYVWDPQKLDEGARQARLSEAEKQAIKQNVVFLFCNRDILNPGKIVEPCSLVDAVEFNWGVVR
jgi:hypothetical protein